MKHKRAKDKRLDAARNMPPLKRSTAEGYDFRKDDVTAWISQCSPLMNYFVDFLARNNYIRYDIVAGVWKGSQDD